MAFSYKILVAEPLDGSCGAVGGFLSQRFICSFNNPLHSVTCSFDGGRPENCSPTLVVSIERFGTNPHTVMMTATDEFGQTFSIPLFFRLPGKSITNSPHLCTSSTI